MHCPDACSPLSSAIAGAQTTSSGHVGGSRGHRTDAIFTDSRDIYERRCGVDSMYIRGGGEGPCSGTISVASLDPFRGEGKRKTRRWREEKEKERSGDISVAMGGGGHLKGVSAFYGCLLFPGFATKGRLCVYLFISCTLCG